MSENLKVTLKLNGYELDVGDNHYKVFKSPRGNNVILNVKNNYILDRYSVLELMSTCNDIRTLFNLDNMLGEIDSSSDKKFIALRCLVFRGRLEELQKNEFYYQELFKENAERLGFGKVVSRKSIGKNFPDAWIDKSGELIPVEVKLQSFNVTALKQLMRYMNVYNSAHGYAVAKNLTVDLPDSITFIPFFAFDESLKED